MNLTDDEMRVKVAEICGWTAWENKGELGGFIPRSPEGESFCYSGHSTPELAILTCCPEFEVSVDAALTLCDRLREEGWHCMLVQGSGVWGCSLTHEVSGAILIEKDPSLARAICLAFLKVQDSVAHSL